MKTETRNSRIVRSEMGGFLNPPTHPEHYYSVRGECGCTSLSAAVDSEYVDETTRAKAKQLLDDWRPPALDSPKVKDWIYRVLGYYKGIYKGDGPEPECWNASNLKSLRTNPGDLDSFDDESNAGVHHIRRFYPEYAPTASEFEHAYWGNSKVKPAKIEPEPVDDETSPMERFIEENRLTMTWKAVDSNPSMTDREMNHYKVKISGAGAPFPLHYSKGLGHVKNGRPIPPTLEEVLDCLASDAATVENTGVFEDWCAELGYDQDSRKAEKSFRESQDQAARLKKLLGEDQYRRLLFDTERM